MQISEHFSLEELTITSQKGPDGLRLPNQPGPDELRYLKKLCETLLEPIRALWGCPVTVTSGFRSHDVEMKVSGKDYGQHRKGQAADILPSGMTVVEAYEKIWQSDLPYDQLLLEQNGNVRWIHVSCAPDAPAPRKMSLYSPDNGKSFDWYKKGVVT
jgi:zinc D-Ala-D-Ala carboxypeptidase